MKKLLLIWIFSGSLDGIGQDTVKHRIDLKAQGWIVNVTIDTTRSVLLVTGNPPSFIHAVYGYCVRKNGVCVGHLDNRQRLFKLPVRVWGCDPKK
jgi:hypothetical protein